MICVITYFSELLALIGELNFEFLYTLFQVKKEHVPSAQNQTAKSRIMLWIPF